MSKVECPDCGAGFASAAGMASHRRSRHELDADVLAAVRADLDGVSGLRSLKAQALKLGGAMDDSMSARDLPQLSKQLCEVLTLLGVVEVVDEESDGDAIDEVAKARERRRKAAADV